jgi:hypothetical protein
MSVIRKTYMPKFKVKVVREILRPIPNLMNKTNANSKRLESS